MGAIMNPHSPTKNYFQSDLSSDQLEEFVLADRPRGDQREHLCAFFYNWLTK